MCSWFWIYSSGNDNHLGTNHVPQFMYSAHQLRNTVFTMNTCLFHHHHSGKQASKQASKQTSKQTNKQINKQTNKTNKQTDKQTKQTNKQTDKQTNRQTCIAPTWNHAILEFPILTTFTVTSEWGPCKLLFSWLFWWLSHPLNKHYLSLVGNEQKKSDTAN